MILLLVLSALTPLTLFGGISLYNLQKSLRRSIEQSYEEITSRASDEIDLYLTNARQLLETAVADLSETELNQAQRNRILENYVIRFPQFLKLLIHSKEAGWVFSTFLKGNDPDVPGEDLLAKARDGEWVVSRPYLSEDLTPVLWYLFPVRLEHQNQGVLVAQIDLMQLWQWVSETKLGNEGYISVVDKDGVIVASGDPFYKQKILSSEEEVRLNYLSLGDNWDYPKVVKAPGGDVLVSVKLISDKPHWYLVLAQPSREAFAAIRTSTYFLIGLTVFFSGVMILVATGGSRKTLLKPVQQLMNATKAIGKGDLAYQIKELGKDELGQLGESFNKMIRELAQLQEIARRQERLAMFGRIASGLAHDLKHPVKNIEGASKLMETNYQDENYRKTFTNIVNREFSRINQFLEDLRNLTHDMPYAPRPFNLVKLLDEISESFQAVTLKKESELAVRSSLNDPMIFGDPALLRRLFENFVSNAVQALTEKNGKVEVIVTDKDGKVLVQVRDTGHGIPPERLSGLFDEFTTTKGRGLGLGLAIAKKIVQLHGGEISVTSVVEKGTTFFITLPRE